MQAHSISSGTLISYDLSTLMNSDTWCSKVLMNLLVNDSPNYTTDMYETRRSSYSIIASKIADANCSGVSNFMNLSSISGELPSNTVWLRQKYRGVG